MSNFICDMHSHFIMPEYLDEVKSQNFREDNIPMPTTWSPSAHLECMEEAGIDWSMVFLSSPHPYYESDQRCISLMRKMNEYLADMKRDHPKKFGFGAALPHPNNDAAVEEAIYALDVLGADAIKLASNSRGLYMGDKQMEPLFEELNKRHAIIVMHPHSPVYVQPGVATSKMIPGFEFLCDTSRAVLNMIYNGVFQRYPNIKLVVPHNGSFLPALYSRFATVPPVIMEKVGLPTDIDFVETFKKLYFDTSGPLDPNLAFLLSCADPTHIMFGTDYPYTPKPGVIGSVQAAMNFFDKNEWASQYKEDIMSGTCKKLFNLTF